MANEKGYNGWTNYETWNVALWMDNERGTYDHWRERTKELLETSVSNSFLTSEDKARHDLADEIKDEFEEGMPDLEPSTYADLLLSAMSEVNWYEIAKHLIDEVVAEGVVE